MKIIEYLQVGTETITEQTPILDENGNETGEFETVTREIPIRKNIERDMTPDEEAEAEEWERTRPMTPEERMDAIEDALVELAEILVGE